MKRVVLLLNPFLYFFLHYETFSVSGFAFNNNIPIYKNSANLAPSESNPLLQKLYPALLNHIEKYGNPNIPLGSAEGRACYTLRRLHVQGKLSAEDEDILKSLNFRFQFDDIFQDMDFDDMVSRLLKYNENQSEENLFQIPKKYAPDPELGAWVAAVRRIGQQTSEMMEDRQREKLEDIGFVWISNRKCGSKFMKGYRALKTAFVTELLYCCCSSSSSSSISEGSSDDSAGLLCLLQGTDSLDLKSFTNKQQPQLNDEHVDNIMEILLQHYNGGGHTIDDKPPHILFQVWQTLLSDDKYKSQQDWLHAQSEVHEKGNLSEMRIEYMKQLQELGLCW